MTSAPSPASLSTVARPILRPDPVTSATFPSSLPMPPSPLRYLHRTPPLGAACAEQCFRNRALAATLEANGGFRGWDGGPAQRGKIRLLRATTRARRMPYKLRFNAIQL